MSYGTGGCTYCACIAKVAFLSIFQFFLIIYTTYRKKEITRPYRKNKKIQFFFIIHTTYRKKKLHACTAKKNYTTRRFFCTQLTFITSLTHYGLGLGGLESTDSDGGSSGLGGSGAESGSAPEHDHARYCGLGTNNEFEEPEQSCTTVNGTGQFIKKIVALAHE